MNQVVVFDFTTRPSIDGISFNGVCGCAGIISNLDQTCMEDDGQPKSACDSAPGMVEMNGECYKLYSRGLCGPGQVIINRINYLFSIKFNLFIIFSGSSPKKFQSDRKQQSVCANQDTLLMIIMNMSLVL